MVTNLKQLIALCDAELIDREYGIRRQELLQEWDQLSQWLEEHELSEFTEHSCNEL